MSVPCREGWIWLKLISLRGHATRFLLFDSSSKKSQQMCIWLSWLCHFLAFSLDLWHLNCVFCTCNADLKLKYFYFSSSITKVCWRTFQHTSPLYGVGNHFESSLKMKKLKQISKQLLLWKLAPVCCKFNIFHTNSYHRAISPNWDHHLFNYCFYCRVTCCFRIAFLNVLK